MKLDGVGGRLAQPGVQYPVAARGPHLPLGQNRRTDFGHLEPVGNGEVEPVDRPAENLQRHGGVETSRRPRPPRPGSTLRATTTRSCRCKWLFSVITSEVSPAARQEFEARLPAA